VDVFGYNNAAVVIARSEDEQTLVALKP